MSHKSFFRTICILFASALLFAACEKTTESKYQQDVASPKTSEGILYHCYWTSGTGEKLLVEFRVQDETVTEILINGRPSALLECKTAAVYHDRESALTAFANCLELGYECVRVDRVDVSAASNIFGDGAASTWIVVYGHSDEDGDCHWEERPKEKSENSSSKDQNSYSSQNNISENRSPMNLDDPVDDPVNQCYWYESSEYRYYINIAESKLLKMVKK